jgi:hypothetical protein
MDAFVPLVVAELFRWSVLLVTNALSEDGKSIEPDSEAHPPTSEKAYTEWRESESRFTPRDLITQV